MSQTNRSVRNPAFICIVEINPATPSKTRRTFSILIVEDNSKERWKGRGRYRRTDLFLPCMKEGKIRTTNLELTGFGSGGREIPKIWIINFIACIDRNSIPPYRGFVVLCRIE